jgi:hypothetical protein
MLPPLVAASKEAELGWFLVGLNSQFVKTACSEGWWNQSSVQEKMNNPLAACFLWIGGAASPRL